MLPNLEFQLEELDVRERNLEHVDLAFKQEVVPNSAHHLDWEHLREQGGEPAD